MAKGVWYSQGKALTQAALFAYVPALLLLAAVAAQPWISPGALFDDPAAITGAPFYLGLVSNLGAILWAAAASICLFTSIVLKKIGGDKRLVRFFLASGLLTGWLLVDDLFMIHERVFPNYLSVVEGTAKRIVIIAVLAFLFFFRDVILRRSAYVLLLVSLAFLGLSYVMDSSPVHGFLLGGNLIGSETYEFVEDGPKLLGIAGWLAYFARFAAEALAARVAAGAARLDAGRADGSPRQRRKEKAQSRAG